MYVPVENRAGVQPIAVFSSSPQHALGTIVRAYDQVYGEGEFIYLLGCIGTQIGSVVIWEGQQSAVPTYQTALAPATPNLAQPLAVAMSSNVAGKYGWYQVEGQAVVRTNGTLTAANVPVYLAGSGQVTSSAGAGLQVVDAISITTSGTPSSGLAIVEIDRPFAQGQDVALSSIDVYLLAGQSNILARCLTSESPTVPTGKVLQVGTTISDANDPINNVGGTSGVYLAGPTSPWPTMGIDYYNATGRKIAFVQTAVGGSAQLAASLSVNGDWSSTGTLRGAAVSQLNTALSVLQANGYTPVFKGVIWWQGEQEGLAIFNSTPGVTAAAYLTEFANMRAFFRSSTIGGATYPELPFYIVRIGTDPTIAGVDSGYSQIRAAQNTVVQTDPYSYMVWTQAYDLGFDMNLYYSGPHLLAPGYLVAGAEIAKNILSSQGNALRRFVPQVMVRAQSTVTFTNASPTVVSWTAHGLVAGSSVSFVSSGTLPAGVVLYKAYWVSTAGLTANSFQIADTQAHALAGTNSINTTSAGTGTITGTYPAGATTATYFSEGPALIGTPTTSNALFVINGNAAAVPTIGTEMEVVAGVDNTSAIVAFEGFGSSGFGNYQFRHGSGTGASPAYPQSGEFIGQVTWNGWDGTNNTWTAAKALIRGLALNTWTSSDNSTFFQFETTPGSSTTIGQVAALYQGLIVGTGSTDPGLGNVSASGFVRAKDATAIPAGGTQDAGFLFSSTAHFGTFFGSGAPTSSQAQGSIYLRSDGGPSTRLYVNNNGSTGWDGLPSSSYVGVIRIVAAGVNFNSANTDTAVSITLPPGISRYAIRTVRISNASASISTATIGVFTGTGGSGQTIATAQAITVTATAADTLNNTMALTITNTNTMAYNDASLQVRVVNAQGSAATADVIFEIDPLT